MPERIVVIGGRGFIGKPLVRLLLEKGHEVTVVSRGAGAAFPTEEGLRFLRGDVADPQSMMAAIEGASIVYDLAMGGGETWADFERDFVQGTRNVANACLRHRVKRLIYVSSTSALYLGRRSKADESSGPDPKPLKRGFYARGKIEAERALSGMRAAHGLPVVIFRPALVMGRGGMLTHAGFGFWGSNTCCIGWGLGKNPLPLVLARDVAEALCAAADAAAIDGMSFNLAGDVRIPAREYIESLSERSLRRFRYYPRRPWRLWAVDICKWAVKAAARKKDNSFPSYRDLKSRCMLTDLDCSAAKRLLGWKPAGDLETFLRDAVDCHLGPVQPGDLRLPGDPSVVGTFSR